jgi:LPS-assembly lipoprotein
VLSGCGWQLRGLHDGALPKALNLNTSDLYAPLARQLQQTLVRRGVVLDTKTNLSLYLSAETLQKRAVAVTSIGAAAQYELNLSVEYSYNQEGQEPNLPKKLTSQRVFDFIPGSNLAKAEEEQTLLTEMRQELINTLLQNAPKTTHAKP